ncbi:E1-E2 ATPase domain-containing protein [Trichoderma velutinum]
MVGLLMKLGWALQMILLIYYPNYYIHDVTQRSWLLLAKQKSSHDPFLLIPALLILGPLLYCMLYRYSLVDIPKFRGGVVTRETPSQICSCSERFSKCSVHASAKLPDADIRTGLSNDEVSARRETYGTNQIWSGLNWGLWVLNFSFSPSQVFTIAGAILALNLHEWRHIGPICLLWLLMFSTPAVQTWSAGSLAEKVCPDTSWLTTTLRNGKFQKVSTKDLVPGDIVHVSEGLMVPADGIVVACNDLLEVDQSRITGEATPISKNERDRCFWGTDVALDEAFLQVENIGVKTFMGRFVNLTQGINGVAERHKELASRGEYLAVIQLIGVILLIILALPSLLWQFFVSSSNSWAEILSITADMTIIAIRFFSSEAISTIRITSSARLSKTGYVPQDNNAPETLAGVDTICVENSGMITENRYIVMKPYCVSCDPEAVILAASLSFIQKDSDKALHRAVSRNLKQFPQAKARQEQYRVIDSQGMDHKTGRWYTQCIVEATDGTRLFFASGHPYAILELCEQSAPADHQNCEKALKEAIKAFRDQGLGSLGLAQRQEVGNWKLLGALPFFEPPRQSTRSAIKQAAELGVRVKVMSGWDEALVERSAQIAGIEGALLRADMIDDLLLNKKDDFVTHINEADVYTELNVRHREMILMTLQESGHRVAITGSDTSHMPTLRKADLGIAGAATTQGTLSACEFVCNKAAHGLLPLISAIRLSRQAYQQAHNHIVRQIVRTLHVLLTMLFVFLAEGKLLDLRLLLMSRNLIELVEILGGPKLIDTPFQKKPTRWNREKALREVGSHLVVVISKSYFCTFSLPSAERLQMLVFLLAIEDLWIAALMQLGDDAWRPWKSLRVLGPQLAVHLLITAVCVTGWAGESLSVNMKTALHVWWYGLSTLAIVGDENLLLGI